MIGAVTWVFALPMGAGAAYGATVAPPPVIAAVDYQLGGAYTPPAGVTVVTRDVTC